MDGLIEEKRWMVGCMDIKIYMDGCMDRKTWMVGWIGTFLYKTICGWLDGYKNN